MARTNRITRHPVIPVDDARSRTEVEFFFNGRPMKAYEGETISSALFANGITIFGKHPYDGSPQGIFCANGQCAQCLVLANGKAVKSCIVPVSPGMKVEPIEGIPALPADDEPQETLKLPEEFTPEVFIMGGGPAGLSAAIELGREGVSVIIADDKRELGGKLSLQTHNFFGSARECRAGVRGMDIGKILVEEVKTLESVQVWTNSPVVGVFADRKIGVVKNDRYVLVKPDRFLCAAGAREKALAFPGSDLPGVYGAGAFQTLVNRDLVKPTRRLFIIGGGNVGLIAAYHALQAGIDVIGIVEALPKCGGYKVHLDKIKRLGIPVWTSHTVVRAHGDRQLERITIAEIDQKFQPIPGTEADFEVDTLLIAVGLSSVNEMLKHAESFGMNTYAAGDADVIAEASAAIFGGKIAGRKILIDMGFETTVPAEWEQMAEMLRTKHDEKNWPLRVPEKGANTIYPVVRCVQEIPCNPCAESCAIQSLNIESAKMTGLPGFSGKCLGCGRCVAICPGLSITLVDEGYDPEKKKALAVLPWEMPDGTVNIGDSVITVGFEGEIIGQGRIVALREAEWQDQRRLLSVEVPFEQAQLVAGIQIRRPAEKSPSHIPAIDKDDDYVVCRCERVTKKQIKDKIESGCHDFNALKAELRVGMGPCGGKTCTDLVWRIFMECGIERNKVQGPVYRPFEMEVPLSAFISGENNEK